MSGYGFRFSHRLGGGEPVKVRFPLAKSMNGAGTRAAARVRAGDLAVMSTETAYTTASARVARTLIEADKASNPYEEGGVRAGILGVFDSPVATDSAGAVMAETSNGGYLPKVPGIASLNPKDSNGHSMQAILIATPDTVFRANLAVAAASRAVYLALKGQLAGLTFTNATGGSEYTVNVTDTGEELCLRIVDVDPNDSSFLSVFVSFRDEGLTPTGSYCQIKTSVPYA